MVLALRDRTADERQERRRLTDELLALFKQSPHLSRAFVQGLAPKEEDIDDDDPAALWLAFRCEMYRPAVESLEALLSTNFNILFPGRCCRIDPPGRVLGFEYLFVHSGDIRLLEICLLPSEGAAAHPALKGARPVYVSDAEECEPSLPADAAPGAPFVEAYSRARPALHERLSEVFARGLLLRHHIGRAEVFLNYEGTYRLNVALRNLLMAALDPPGVGSGWHGLREAAARTLSGAKWADALEGAIRRAPLYDRQSLTCAMLMARDMAQELAPEVFREYEQSISYYIRASEQT